LGAAYGRANQPSSPSETKCLGSLALMCALTLVVQLVMTDVSQLAQRGSLHNSQEKMAGRILVSVDDEVDVSEISSLRAFVGEERGRASAVIIDVSINATKVI